MPRATAFVLVAVALALASPAAADDGDRCARGLAARDAGDLPRAFALLEPCTGDEARAAFAEVKRSLAAGDYTPVNVLVTPEGADVHIEALGDPFRAPRLVWLPFGAHTVELSADGYQDAAIDIELDGRERYPLLVRLPKEAGATLDRRGGAAVVDFGDEVAGGGAAERITGGPEDVERETLLPKRYRGGGVSTAVAPPRQRRVRVGPAVGVAITGLGGDAAADPRAGAVAGVFLDARVAPWMSLRAEVAFAMKGGDAPGGDASLSYVEVPVTARYVHRRGRWQIGAGGGLALGVAVDDDLGAADAAPIDLGVAALASAGARLGPGVLLADLRFVGGVVDVLDGPGTIRNRAAALVLGYAF